MSIVSVSLSRTLFKEEFMKEKIENIRLIFDEFRDHDCLDLSQEGLLDKLTRLEDLIEELEFLCEEVT